MGMLDRFADIVKANINDLLDKCEDPAKMIDQYLRDLTENLAEVKQETAGVMAEEARTKRMVDDAEAMGADAVIGIRYTSASVMQGAAEITAYGTAVRIAGEA